MFVQTRLFRLITGLGILVLTLVVSFAVFIPQTSRWGATDAEVALSLPGDELAPRPIINWTNATTINARPEQVWPWVAQLGDTRGGFYSYTFIEDRVGAIAGASGYTVDYENANRIVAEWQHPAPGDVLIQGILKVRKVRPGEYLLADAIDSQAMQWTWLWRLYSINGGEQTRLIVRCLIQVPEGSLNPAGTAMMNAGGFVMQQRMLHGLKLRAEGGVEPPYIEAVEIVLWLTTLVIGLIGAGLFLFQREWRKPLVLAIVSVVVLVALTFTQPSIWVRVLVNAALLVDLWWSYPPTAQVGPALQARSAAH